MINAVGVGLPSTNTHDDIAARMSFRFNSKLFALVERKFGDDFHSPPPIPASLMIKGMCSGGVTGNFRRSHRSA